MCKKEIIIKYELPVETIGIKFSVFVNGPGDQGSIPGRVILKTKKMLLDATLLNS